MNNVKSFLTAFAFSMAGVAVHANAATEKRNCASGVCFQLTPVADKGASTLAGNGFNWAPAGESLAENGSSKTPQRMLLESQGQV